MTLTKLNDLTALAGLLLRENVELFYQRRRTREGELHCSGCGAARRMELSIVSSPLLERPPQLPISVDELISQLHITTFALSCVQCQGRVTGLIYPGPSGATLALFSEQLGGLSTSNTPPPVAYYLDQAYLSQSVSAHSAAVAMYRAALEQLLYEQGFTKRMLGSKIAELLAKRGDNNAPKWAQDLDVEFLTVLKNLGDGAIHPNDGSVGQQAELDQELLVHVQATFVHLLEIVYEEPRRKAERLRVLQSKADKLKK